MLPLYPLLCTVDDGYL